MNLRTFGRKALILATLAVTLALPASTFAAQEGSTTETLSIPAEYTLSNVPASITYSQSGDEGTGYAPSNNDLVFSPTDQLAGEPLSQGPSGYAGAIKVQFASSFGFGTSLTVTASDLTGGFPGDITASHRMFVARGTSAGLGVGNNPLLNGTVTPVDGSTPLLLATWNSGDPSAPATVGVRPIVTVPGGSVGTFHGTLTFGVVGL